MVTKGKKSNSKATSHSHKALKILSFFQPLYYSNDPSLLLAFDIFSNHAYYSLTPFIRDLREDR